MLGFMSRLELQLTIP